MTELNKNIDDFLDYYFSFPKAPEYAVLIKGAWGSGKSWFVEKALARLKENEGKYLYVSLYGMTCFEDIENSFFEQMHPILSSKGMKLTSKIAKGLLKATIKLDLDGNGKSDSSIKIPTDDFGIPEYLKNTDSFVLVFDDLERCSMDINEVLGYINQFVEHQEYKVLIIANEMEILAKLDKDKCYSRAKEKLIGKTFEITPNIEQALDFFISSSTLNLHAFYEDNLANIKLVYEQSECKNLRHLKQSLWDFERLYSVLPDSTFDKVELKEDILKLFLCFSFEIRSANFTIEDISKIKNSIYDDILEKSNENKSLYSLMSTKYPIIDFSETILEESIWVEVFDKGIVDAIKIKESIEKSKYYQTDNTDNWVKLWHYHDLSDESFDKLVSLVEEEIVEYKYENQYIVKHIAGLFIRLSDIGLIPDSKSDLQDKFKAYVDYLFSKKLLTPRNDDYFEDSHWGGLGYAGLDISEFNSFNEYLELNISKTKVDSFPNVAHDLLDLMLTDVTLFSWKLITCNREENIYYDTPILNYISPEGFVKQLLLLPGGAFRRVGYMFKERYSHHSFNLKLLDELDWLKKVKSLLNIKREELIGKVSSYRIGLLIDSHLTSAIENLEQHS